MRSANAAAGKGRRANAPTQLSRPQACLVSVSQAHQASCNLAPAEHLFGSSRPQDVNLIAEQEGYLSPQQVISIFCELYRDPAERPICIPNNQLVTPEVCGSRCYSRAWMGIVDATHSIMPPPATHGDKNADIHSTRTYTQSMFALPELIGRGIEAGARPFFLA